MDWLVALFKVVFTPPQHWEFDVKNDLQDVRMFHKMRSSTTFVNRVYQHCWTMIDPLQVDENEPQETTTLEIDSRSNQRACQTIKSSYCGLLTTN